MELLDRYSDRVRAQLEDAFERAIDLGYEFVDNYRVGRADDSGEMAEFERIADSGCCGSHEEEVVIDGVKYWIGFNHGH